MNDALVRIVHNLYKLKRVRSVTMFFTGVKKTNKKFGSELAKLIFPLNGPILDSTKVSENIRGVKKNRGF